MAAAQGFAAANRPEAHRMGRPHGRGAVRQMGPGRPARPVPHRAGRPVRQERPLRRRVQTAEPLPARRTALAVGQRHQPRRRTLLRPGQLPVRAERLPAYARPRLVHSRPAVRQVAGTRPPGRQATRAIPRSRQTAEEPGRAFGADRIPAREDEPPDRSGFRRTPKPAAASTGRTAQSTGSARGRQQQAPEPAADEGALAKIRRWASG